MSKKSFDNMVSITSVCCALLLFIAVWHAPREYYWLLRVLVSIGALLVILKNIRQFRWVVLFTLILILFNPLFPIFLYSKTLWTPIDIAAGLLFLIEVLINRPKKAKPPAPKKKVRKYERDRIY